MSWLEAIVGGGLAVAGMLGSSSNKAPAPATVDAEEYFNHPVAEAMAQKQFDIAQSLSIENPQLRDAVFRMLPVKDMGPKDRARFAKEYAEIKRQIGVTALEQAKEMGGQTLQSLVERGVISQEQADRQLKTNTAAINSMEKIYNDKMKAAEIGMARNEFVRSSGSSLDTAGVIAQVHNASSSLMNKAKSAGLQYMAAKEKGYMGLEDALLRANTQTNIGVSNANFSNLMDMGVGAVDIGKGIYDSYKQAQVRDSFLNAPGNEAYRKMYEATKSGIFK